MILMGPFQLEIFYDSTTTLFFLLDALLFMQTEALMTDTQSPFFSFSALPVAQASAAKILY